MHKKTVVSRRVKKSAEPCQHPAIFKSMCVSCGETLVPSAPVGTSESRLTISSNSDSSSSSSNGSRQHFENSSSLLFAGGQRLLLSKDEALRVQQSKSLGLQSARKLALVLDLDHTLVHATGAWFGYATALGPLLGDSSNDIRRIFIEEGPGMQPKCYLVKQRPNLEAFLKEAHTICQMTIYTAGTRLYAEAVAKLIDPLGIYFAQRIVSRSDIPNDKSEGMEKSLQRIFLEDASMVVVMDDREDVWKGEQGAQLLLVRPYHYFTGCEEVNNAAGSPLVTSGPLIKLSGGRPGSILEPSSLNRPIANGGSSTVTAHSDYDDQLPRCLVLLKEIHTKFFSPRTVSSNDVSSGTGYHTMTTIGACNRKGTRGLSVADIINEMKLSILAGCTIAFSGVIPVRASVEQHPCWLLAHSMGARVTTEVTVETTHLLTVSMPPSAQGQGQPGLTSKAKECLARGDVWVLHPDWLAYCRFSLAKAVESTFMLIAQTPGRPLPKPILRPHPQFVPSSSTNLVVDDEYQGIVGCESRVRFREELRDICVSEQPLIGGKRRRYTADQIYEEPMAELIHDCSRVDADYQDAENAPNDYISNDEDEEEFDEGREEYTIAVIDGDDDDDDDSSDGSMDNFEAAILLR